MSLHAVWSSYEAARQHYLQLSSVMSGDVVVAEADMHNMYDMLQREGFVGRLDFLSIQAAGREVATVKLIHTGALRPRVLMVRYLDFWGMERRWREGAGGGVSLLAMVAMANRLGYRLVWCLRNLPHAVFVDELAGVGRDVLKTLRAKDCFRTRVKDVTWQRDAEVRWDAAQTLSWHSKI